VLLRIIHRTAGLQQQPYEYECAAACAQCEYKRMCRLVGLQHNVPASIAGTPARGTAAHTVVPVKADSILTPDPRACAGRHVRAAAGLRGHWVVCCRHRLHLVVGWFQPASWVGLRGTRVVQHGAVGGRAGGPPRKPSALGAQGAVRVSIYCTLLLAPFGVHCYQHTLLVTCTLIYITVIATP
jgi:hypothetical protein